MDDSGFREVESLKEQLSKVRAQRDFECRRADQAWQNREREAYLPPEPMTPSLRAIALVALAVGIVLSVVAMAVAGRFAVELEAAPGCTMAGATP